MVLRLLALLLWLSALTFGGELKLSEKELYQFGGYLHYFEDAKGVETIDSIRQRTFKAVKEETPSFGFTDSIYWFSIRLIPDDAAAQKSWWLTFDYPLLEYIELYGFKGDGFNPTWHAIGGRLHPYVKRELAQRQFAFSINDLTQPLTLYIRVKTQSSMQVPMQLKTSKYFFESSQSSQLLFGFYYGVFLIIVLYNIIMYVYTKENDYLRYLFFVSSFIGWQLTLDGIGIQYIWSEWEWMIVHGGVFWMSAGLFSVLLFSRYFLRIKNYFLWIDRLFIVLIIATFILMLFSIILPYGTIVPIMAVLSIVVPILLWISGILIWRKHYRPARFYVLGWTVFLLGSVLLALNKLNVIHGFYVFNYAQQIGSALEMIFLSWALADRVKLLQNEYVDKLNRMNVMLQDKVNEALDQAREKDKIMLKQSHLAALGEMIEQIAHQWRQPLQTMALINQDLYVKQQFGQLSNGDIERSHEQVNNNLQYMSKTIDDFRVMHQSEKDREHFALEEVIAKAISLNEASLKYFQITCSVESESEHFIKSYKNELLQILMNLIKNSRDAIVEREQPNGYIRISVTSNDHRFYIMVDDNGGGISDKNIKQIFDPYFTTKDEVKGSGIGLYISRTVIEENLHGSINVENTEGGARFIITLPRPE